MAALAEIAQVDSHIRSPGIRTLLTTRTALMFTTGLLLLAMSCGSSGSESSPSLVTTSTPIPTLPPPTPSPEPTSTPVPTLAGVSKDDQATMSGGEYSLLPIAMSSNDTPEEIISQFPAAEIDCLKEHYSVDRMAEILQRTASTMEGTVMEDCLSTTTFIRITLGVLLPATGPFSDSTNACLAVRLSDPNSFAVGGDFDDAGPFTPEILLPYFLCLNDEERSSIAPVYAVVVGAAVEAIEDRVKRAVAGHDLDLDALECLANELDSADLQALAKLGEDDSPTPPSLIAAMTKCGLTEPPN